MNEFETYIFEAFARTIRSWNASDVEGVYALAFLILNDDDDLRRPTVCLLYNTDTEWKRQRDKCADPAEARWNHPFWLQTAQASIATSYPDFGCQYDTKGILLREAWIRQQGLWYDDQFKEEHFEQALEIGGRICGRFDQMCVRVATQLRDDGTMQDVFARDLAIIFFDREALSPQAIELTHRANPKNLISEFSAFIDESQRWDGA